MGHSKAEKARSRERILDAAARQIRKGGLDSLSIGELMKSAKLTHGSFYVHFPSRSALIAAALERAMERGAAAFGAADGAAAGKALAAILNLYLSPEHRDNPAAGCAIATLASEVGRSEDANLRALMRRQLESYITRMNDAMGGGDGTPDAALVALSTMMGALMLSRVFKGDPRSKRILDAARRAVRDGTL